MTNQEVFDKVARHLLTQKVQSQVSDYGGGGDGGGCAYRGENGTSCAIGCLIPNELYKPEMEGKSVSGLQRNSKELLELFRNTDSALLSALQDIHDDIDPHCWAERLNSEAVAWDLDVSVLKEFE